MQGARIGEALLGSALYFARQRGFSKIYLDTFAGLKAAKRLYQNAGFELVAQNEGEIWGRMLEEQRWELTL